MTIGRRQTIRRRSILHFLASRSSIEQLIRWLLDTLLPQLEFIFIHILAWGYYRSPLATILTYFIYYWPQSRRIFLAYFTLDEGC